MASFEEANAGRLNRVRETEELTRARLKRWDLAPEVSGTELQIAIDVAATQLAILDRPDAPAVFPIKKADLRSATRRLLRIALALQSRAADESLADSLSRLQDRMNEGVI